MEVVGVLARGDLIRVRHVNDDTWCRGEVILASPNGRSVAIELAGGMVRAVEGWIGGVLPVIVDYDAQTVTGLTGDEYEIEVTP